MKFLTDRGHISRNITIHDQIAHKYDALHGEIFNDIEQSRLFAALTCARDAVRSNSCPIRALDFGCGSGNLTRHLLDLGLAVTAADVSQGFLDLVQSQYHSDFLTTLRLNGSNLDEVPDGSFDLIAVYSVLHHIPDYFSAIQELARVCKRGGVIIIDHEATEEFWHANPVYTKFRSAALRFDWRKYTKFSNYLHKARRLFNPRHTNEGDIHVWADDHIEWTRIKNFLANCGFQVVLDEDYLLYHNLYQRQVYDRYLGHCTDTKVMIFRKDNNSK